MKRFTSWLMALMLLVGAVPALAAQGTLTLAVGSMRPDATYDAFTAAHPDVTVVFDNYSAEAQDVINALMNHDDSVDIYLVDASGLSALKEHSHALELTDDGILEQVSRMYPFVQQALSPNGKLVAVPQSQSWGGRLLRYSKKALETLKLTEADLPATWFQLIEFIEHWDENYGRDYPDITPLDPSLMPDIREVLMLMMCSNYTVYMDAVDDVKFDSPVFRETLERLDEARFGAIEGEESESGLYNFNSSNVLFSDYAIAGIHPSLSEQYYVLWPLSFVEGEQAYLPLYLEVFVVNPFSKNHDLAVEYVRTSLEHMSAALRATVCPGVDEPIRVYNYEEQLLLFERKLKKIDEQLTSASEEDKQALETERTSLERDIEEYKRSAWAATAEDIARHRAQAERMIMPTFDGFDCQSKDDAPILIQRYIDRQISVDQFLSGIDQEMRMMLMEG